MAKRFTARYRRYTPGPDPLAPPPDLAKAVRAIADDVMYGYSAEQAMREYLRREGYDDFLRQIAERRQELLQKTNLGGTLQEAKKLLDDAVLARIGAEHEMDGPSVLRAIADSVTRAVNRSTCMPVSSSSTSMSTPRAREVYRSRGR